MKLLRRWRWPQVEGKVIDKRHIKKYRARYNSTAVTVFVDEYLFEFTDPSGKRARVAIKEKSVHVPGQALFSGESAAIHVNRAGTKAVFGRLVPAVTRAERRRRDKERRQRDEQRFREKLDDV